MTHQPFFTPFTASERKYLSPTLPAILTETGICNLFSLFLLSFKTVHSHSQHLFKGLYFIPLKENVKHLLLERVNVPSFPFFGFVFETGSLYIYI